MVFPVVVYCYESWTIKKTKHQRIDAFELQCWRRLLKVPRTARISNQSILREISPEYSLEGLMLKLKLQYFGHLMWTDDSLEKSLMLGMIEERKKRGHQMMRWLDSIADAKNMNLGKLQEMVKDREAWQAAFHDVAKSQTWLGNWRITTTICSQASLSVIHSLNKYFRVPTKCCTQYLVLCASLFMESPLSPISLSLPWTLNLQHTTYTMFLPNPEILSPRFMANVSSFLWSFLTSIFSSLPH